MTRRKLEWHGKGIARGLREAARRAVNRVMSECVIHAKQHHPWRNRTGTLEGSIRIVNYATAYGMGVRGLWGSTDVRYALRLELGFQGPDALGRMITTRPHPYLRPAAEAKYPQLGAAIRAEWERAK